MGANAFDTDELLGRAAAGDREAVGDLMSRHRQRLRRMVAVRLDARIVQRIDPSDVVQETLIEASQMLPQYLESRPLPFYPWLRQIAWKRLDRLHGQHIGASKRSVDRERSLQFSLTDASLADLAHRLVGTATSPSRALVKAEQHEKLRAALDAMESADREVLVMWYLEELTVEDIAAVLKMTPAGVKSRHFRALRRLTMILNRNGRED